MKRFLVVVCVIVVGVWAATASAQTATPYIQVYFDPGYSLTVLEGCPVDPVGTLYVVAHNFEMWMQSIEYAIEYPPQVTWLGDAVDDQFQLKIGSSPLANGGIAITWTSRGNAFSPLLLQTASVLYNCENCVEQNVPITVLKHPSTAWPEMWKVRAIRNPDFAEVWGVGMTSLLCATVPVEETTWGGIKALYGN